MTNTPNQGVELRSWTAKEAAFFPDHKWDRFDRPRTCERCDYIEHDGSGIGWHPCSVTYATPTPASSGVLVEALRLARPIVEADWYAAREQNDADWEGMSWTALDAIDQALSSASTDTGAREGENCSDCGGTGDNPTPIKWPGRYCPTCEGTGKAPNTDTPTDEYRRGVADAAKVCQHVREIIGAATGSSIGIALAEASDRIRALSPEPLGTAKERGE